MNKKEYNINLNVLIYELVFANENNICWFPFKYLYISACKFSWKNTLSFWRNFDYAIDILTIFYLLALHLSMCTCTHTYTTTIIQLSIRYRINKTYVFFVKSYHRSNMSANVCNFLLPSFFSPRDCFFSSNWINQTASCLSIADRRPFNLFAPISSLEPNLFQMRKTERVKDFFLFPSCLSWSNDIYIFMNLDV